MTTSSGPARSLPSSTRRSHREAPAISKDPSADNTDVYAFVSPNKSDTVTLVANYIPFEEPAGGPNFYEFDPTVRYDIDVRNGPKKNDEITYQFQFRTETRNPNTFLYNTGVITSLDDPTWNRPQFYSVTRVDEHGERAKLADNVRVPPVKVGVRSTPNYESPRRARWCSGSRTKPRTTCSGTASTGRPYLDHFPYVGVPIDGYDSPHAPLAGQPGKGADSTLKGVFSHQVCLP